MGHPRDKQTLCYCDQRVQVRVRTTPAASTFPPGTVSPVVTVTANALHWVLSHSLKSHGPFVQHWRVICCRVLDIRLCTEQSSHSDISQLKAPRLRQPLAGMADRRTPQRPFIDRLLLRPLTDALLYWLPPPVLTKYDFCTSAGRHVTLRCSCAQAPDDEGCVMVYSQRHCFLRRVNCSRTKYDNVL